MLKLLKPYDILSPKVRLGGLFDGGYVLPLSLICNSSELYTYGVGGDISFEKDFVLSTDHKAYCYDHTIDSPQIDSLYSNNIFFKKEGLSGTKQEFTDNFLNHYQQNNSSGLVLLKIDVEFAEYEFFLNSNITKLAELTSGIVVEFHGLDQDQCRYSFTKICLELSEYFVLNHIHANNWGGTFPYEEGIGMFFMRVDIPRVVEMTFVNKKLIKGYQQDHRTYPLLGLDRPNRADVPDIDLYFTKL